MCTNSKKSLGRQGIRGKLLFGFNNIFYPVLKPVRNLIRKYFPTAFLFYYRWQKRHKQYPLDVRVYKNLLLLSTFVVITAVIQNIILHTYIVNTIISALVLFLIFGFYYASRYLVFSFATRIFFLLLVYIALVIIWIINDGFAGPIPVYFYAFMIMSLFFLDRYRYLALLVNLSAVGFAVGWQLFFPDSIVHYDSPESQAADWSISYVALAIAGFLLVRIINRGYEREKHIIELQKQKLERLNERLTSMAHFDYLTGIFNRRMFMERIAERFAVPEEQREPFFFLLADLDHFKKVNDRHGHQTGDEVLRVFAKGVRNLLGEDVCFARLGGEEFGIVLPGKSLATAKKTAQKILEMVHGLEVETVTGKKVGGISVSIGVARMRPKDTPEKIYHRADAALYKAKKGGRDRVEVG